MVIRRKSAVVVSFLVIMIGLLFFIWPSRINHPLLVLLASKNDRVALEVFFRRIVSKVDFGYTIFGSKPVSITGYFDPLPAENILVDKGENGIIRDGWEVWKRFRFLFPMKDYLFLEEASDVVSTLTEIILVNKLAFTETVNANLDLFRKVLRKEVSAEKMLAELEKGQTRLCDLLGRHEGLLGIVLGYGRENALLYQRRMELNIHNPWPQFSLSKITPKKGHQTLEEEIAFLRDLDVVEEHHMLRPIELPAFFGIKESTESKELIEQYRATEAKILQFYYSKDFLKHTLTRLH